MRGAAKAEIGQAIQAAEKFSAEAPRPLYRDIAPPPDYPIDDLGDVLGAGAKAIAAGVQASDALAGQSVLSTAALAVQGHVDIALPNMAPKPT